jgi:hypothetical protein
MLRVDHLFASGGMRGNAAVRSRTAPAARAIGAAALIAAMFGVMPASAQSPASPAPSPAPSPAAQHAVSAPATTASKTAKTAKKPLVSPYARAAAQQGRNGRTSVSHPGQTMVQAMGKPHLPHPAAPHK